MLGDKGVQQREEPLRNYIRKICKVSTRRVRNSNQAPWRQSPSPPFATLSSTCIRDCNFTMIYPLPLSRVPKICKILRGGVM